MNKLDKIEAAKNPDTAAEVLSETAHNHSKRLSHWILRWGKVIQVILTGGRFEENRPAPDRGVTGT
jgi:hypothetical protein